ncbi:MAG: hypothetical protein JOZ69_22275 [Myxococcales bacterium]|nr:hypothetical protein [Myxococcales bacterium]
MSERWPPWSGDWTDWLRVVPPAPAEARARVRARLEAVIPAMRGGRSGGGGTAGSGRGGAGLPTLGGPAAALATFVGGGLVGAALYAGLAPRPPVRVAYIDRPVPLAGAVAAAVRPSSASPLAGSGETGDRDEAASAPLAAGRQPTPEAPAADCATAAPAAAAPGRAAKGPVPLHPSARARSQLSLERLLLDDARVALVQGEPERSLAELGRHRREFPGGVLAEERDAMEVEALVRAGRLAEARTRAEEFEARRGGSLFGASVAAALRPPP